MSAKVTDLEQAVDLALKLSPLDKLRLVERVISSLKQEFETTPPTTTTGSLESERK